MTEKEFYEIQNYEELLQKNGIPLSGLKELFDNTNYLEKNQNNVNENIKELRIHLEEVK